MEKLWNSDFVKLNIANFLLFFSFYMLTPLLPIYLNVEFGAGKHTIGAVLAGYTIVALIARPLSGFIVDSFPRKKVLLTVYALFALFFGCYLIAGSLFVFTVVRTLHGAPFGATTVANSTMAVDSLPARRRSEGIGYYGLSNNIASALAPSVSIYIYELTQDFNILFFVALVSACAGWLVNSTLKVKGVQVIREKRKLSAGSFFLMKGWRDGIVVMLLAFSYGVISTYLAIYGKEELGVTEGTGMYFLLLSLGLMASRLIGSRSLARGRIVKNACGGMLFSLVGYFVFAAVHNMAGYYASAIIIGLGNGHMYPAMQNIFINLALPSQRGIANASILTSWDAGIGLGVLLGGAIAETLGYHAAFWTAAIGNMIGVVFFLIYARKTYIASTDIK